MTVRSGIAALERRVVLERYGHLLWMLRLLPAHAVYYLAGIAIPPHERYLLSLHFGWTKENNIIASRGTSKSFTMASLGATVAALLNKDLVFSTLSASGFRGGKELFKDAERLLLGQLKSQVLPGEFMAASVASAKLVRRDPAMWEMPFRSGSRHNTVPTNNADALRGLRTNRMLIDERNTYPEEDIHGILRPMMNVGTDFRRTAAGIDSNRVFQISTIDYSLRGWWKELRVAQDLQRREFEAWEARKRGDWATYDQLMSDHDGQLANASFSLTRMDYTDLLIPDVVNTLDGEHSYSVHYPPDPGVQAEDIRSYDPHDRVTYYYTYPVQKKELEEPLRNGTVDTDVWRAEQRNIEISASGNVFEFELIQARSERPIWSSDKAPRSRRRIEVDEDDVTKDEFFSPLLFTCGDPCVLASDYARESDESSFLVIRLGELAEGEFDPWVSKVDEEGRVILGKTPWNNVIWAESHRHLQAAEGAAKLRELKKRYNLLRTDTIPGMALDRRGGGSAVRDELGNPKPEVKDGVVDPTFRWEEVLKIYDPNDVNGFAHYAAYNDPAQYWGGLRLLTTTNNDNVDWTYAVRGMFQQRKLWIAQWLPPSRWATALGIVTPNGEPDVDHPDYQRWLVGFEGIRKLKQQLIRLQKKVSERGVITFYMPGDRAKETAKKDLWAALIYAGALAREHLLAQTRAPEQTAPMVPGLVVSLNRGIF